MDWLFCGFCVTFLGLSEQACHNCFQAMPQLRQLVAGFPPQLPGFSPGSGHVGFVVDNVAQGQVFSKCFGSLCQFSFNKLLHIH
jgi:hypothetical protein